MSHSSNPANTRASLGYHPWYVTKAKDSMFCHACVALIWSNAYDQNTHTPFSCHVNMAEQFALPLLHICIIVMCDIYYSCKLHAQITLLFMTHAE